MKRILVYFQILRKYQPLLKELVKRDITIRYRRSVLGLLWTVLNPLLMMIVMSIVFSTLFTNSIENFPVYVMIGNVVFNCNSEATNRGLSSIIWNASLIKKVYIPKYLFTFARIASSVINIMASFAALILVMVFMRMELHYTLFLGIIPLFCVIVLATGVGLILATATVKFRDIMHLYGVFLTALTYLCPVIYPMTFLSEGSLIYTIVSLNPLTIIMNMFRDLVIYGVMPSIGSFVAAIGISGIVLAIGLYVFYKKQDTFILNL